MLNFIDSIRPYLEILYFVTGGPALAYFAYLALQQIKVAKDVARKASMREAFRLSAEQTHIYITQIIPCINELNQFIKDEKLTFFTEATVNIEDEGIKVKHAEIDDATEQLMKSMKLLLDVVNRLETFSLYFISKVADEKVAYSSLGATFVHSVRELMPFLVMSANNDHHKNIMGLFYIWHTRIEKEKLEKDKKSIEDKIKGMKTPVIVPIGAEHNS